MKMFKNGLFTKKFLGMGPWDDSWLGRLLGNITDHAMMPATVVFFALMFLDAIGQVTVGLRFDFALHSAFAAFALMAGSGFLMMVLWQCLCVRELIREMW